MIRLRSLLPQLTVGGGRKSTRERNGCLHLLNMPSSLTKQQMKLSKLMFMYLSAYRMVMMS